MHSLGKFFYQAFLILIKHDLLCLDIGLLSHPIHTFEYLGQEISRKKWDSKKVCYGIKSRLEEIDLLEISHNDIRLDNIRVL